jgi:carbonic anhydrase
MCCILSVLLLSMFLSAQEHAAPHWSYKGTEGPEHWGSLSPEYKVCGIGHEQSPIDITNAEIAKLPPIEFNYSPSLLKLIDNGHTVQVNYAPGSYIVIAGKRYDLVQFHFHNPSEEAIRGKRSALVIHLVHKDAAGKLAVVAVLFNEGAANPAIDAMVSHLPSAKGKEMATDATVNAADILPQDRNYYTFTGSLTTPPCSEGVRWLVLQTSGTLSKSSLERLTNLYPNNARPLQPLNGRAIKASK